MNRIGKILVALPLFASLHATVSANYAIDDYWTNFTIPVEDEVYVAYSRNGPVPHIRRYTGFDSYYYYGLAEGGPSPENWVAHAQDFNPGYFAFRFQQGLTQRYLIEFYYEAGADASFSGPTSVAAVGFAAANMSPGESVGTAFRIQAAGGSSALLPEIRNNGQTIVPEGAGAFTLANASWYRLSVDFTRWGGGLYGYSFQLDKIDILGGESAGTNVFAHQGTLLNEGHDEDLRYLAFYGGKEEDGTGNQSFAYNDAYFFAAVPEPSSAAVLAGIGALGLAALRRRRRRA